MERIDLDALDREIAGEMEAVQTKQRRFEQLRQQAEEQTRVEKLGQIEQLIADAKAFRLEASQSPSEAERATLRGYAKSCEETAAEIRAELGMESEPATLQPEVNEPHGAWVSRQIWGNFNLSLLSLSAWFILYFVGEANTGTVGYVAQVLCKPAFHAFMLFAGLLFVFLVVRRYFYTVTEYLNQKAAGESFELDFRECSAFGRLFFVLGLLYVITQFLASIYQVTL
ncbi:hypothetical protein [Spirosoma litoris]